MAFRRRTESPPDRRYSDDPFLEKLRPPPGETLEEKAERLQRQQEAIRVSREIDAGILESKKAMERRKKAIKVLLLGAWCFRTKDQELTIIDMQGNLSRERAPL